MEIAIDLMTGLRERVAAAGGFAETGGFDWFGAHARLTAAHAARRALSRFDSRNSIASGGFANWTVTAVDRDHASQVVNPTDLADRKSPAGIERSLAGQPVAGGRGHQ